MSIASLLNQSATFEHPGALDRYGNPSFGAPSTVRVRFEKITKTIVDSKGENQPIDGRVFVSPSNSVLIADRFTYGGESYRVMKVEDVVDGRGVIRHREVMVQVWQ